MLLGTLIVGGTLAYLTASKDKINTITVGKVEVVIEEPGVNNNSVEWGINSKPVYLTATNDSIDGVVRAMIIPEFLNENGEYINCPGAAQNAPVSNKIVMGDITFVALDNYAIQNGYALDFSELRRHHEIYISDPRKVAPEKLKTVLRHPIRKA